MENQIDRFLRLLIETHGSDLHISAGRVPQMRIHGAITPIEGEPVWESDRVLGLLKEIMPERNIKELVEEWDTDCAYQIPGLARKPARPLHLLPTLRRIFTMMRIRTRNHHGIEPHRANLRDPLRKFIVNRYHNLQR